MVLVHQVHEPVEKRLAFLLSEAVDVPDVPANWENALPSGYRVSADDGMNRFQFIADIFRRSPFFVVYLKTTFLSNVFEARLSESSRQCLEKPLVRLADSVIYLITGRP